jgi:hypothetical protein
LFLTKVAALLAAPGLAAIALNIFVGVLWPLFFRSSSVGFLFALRAWPAYWITILLASAFSVFTILALQGLAANLLPRQLFLRLSAFLQAAVMSLFVSVYFLEPSLESPAALTLPQNQRLLEFLPSTGSWPSLTSSMDRRIPRSHPWQKEAGSASLWLHSEPARHSCCATSASCEG